MSLFLVGFIALYGSAHLYFYRKLTRAFALTLGWRLLIGVALMTATVAPMLVRVAEHHAHPALALAIAYPGYFWLAILFLFIVISTSWGGTAALNQLRLLIRRRPRRIAPHSDRRRFLVCLVLALACAGYGLYEAAVIRTERVVLTTPKLARGERLRIVQLSDVHMGLLLGERRLERIVRAAEEARPDILVSTGDLIDGLLTHDGEMLRHFSRISPQLGALAIPGNHEYYVGFARARAMTEAAGFKVLKGERVKLGSIVIAGADDPTARRTGTYVPLTADPDPGFTLLLKHQPWVTTDIPFDLQLSGHVHKGQIFPFNLVTWLRFRIPCGLTRLEDGRQVYVSRGTGTWGPPIRFLAKPEVTVIDLVGPAAN